MNRRMVFHTVGLIILLESVLLLFPLLVSLIYREKTAIAFLATMGIAAVLGAVLLLVSRPKSKVIYAKEGFAITALAWLALSAVGALPFFLSRQIPYYIDAFFETVSGFTTTGASILRHIESLGRGLLFWRSFSHWIGGMGVLVFLMAFLPNLSDRPIHILRAEMPGPSVGKLVPKVRDTAKILYFIYLGMTLVQFLLLFFGGMDWYDSLVHTFGTAGTGGFSNYSLSVGKFGPYHQWVIAVFMLLFGVNFNLYYLILRRRLRTAVRSTELKVYLGIVLVSILILCVDLSAVYSSPGALVRDSVFQVSSIISTTGYSTVDFNAWPAASKTVLLILMFLGSCAGSTAGGLKISRVTILFKSCLAEIRHMLHPRSIGVLRFEGKKVEKETQKGVMVYFAVYMIFFFIILFGISTDGLDLETNFSAVAACFNNVGPGFGRVGATECYALYSPFSKLLLSLAMLLGRLEIWPILLTFYPASWKTRA